MAVVKRKKKQKMKNRKNVEFFFIRPYCQKNSKPDPLSHLNTDLTPFRYFFCLVCRFPHYRSSKLR